MLSVFIPTLIYALRLGGSRRVRRGESSGVILVWDVQTGVIIGNNHVGNLGEMAFIGNQVTIALLDGGTFCAYDGLTGTQVCGGPLSRSPFHQLGAHWAHRGSLRFATSSDTDEGLVISIYELQTTSEPPLFMVDSFPTPPYRGEFSFSPVSFHASFVTKEEVVILNLRDQKNTFQTKAGQHLYRPQGCFSPDGCFFACGTEGQEVHIWKNTPTGYVPWNTIVPRLPSNGFSFSASGTSILSWGPEGTQLLDQDNHLNPPSPDKTVSAHRRRKHLVAYSSDSTRIATAQQEGSVIVILDPLSGTPRQSIDTNTQIRDIGIVDDTIHVMDAHGLISWHLEAAGTAWDIRDARRVAVELATHTRGGDVERMVLSHNCSQIAFNIGETVFLYDVKAREIVDKRTMDDEVTDIQFSPDGHHLCVTTIVGIYNGYERPSIHCFVKLEVGEDRRFTSVTKEFLQDEWSKDSLLRPHNGYCIGSGSDWVEDSGGSKVLWLPTSWRTEHGLGARWSGNFLAIVGGHNTAPVIVEFRP